MAFTYVVVEVAPGHSDEVRSTLNVEHTIIVVLVAGQTVVGKVTVVNPDVSRLFNINEILALGRLLEAQVADDDIGDAAKSKTASNETCVGTDTDDAGVRAELDDITAAECARDLDDAAGSNGSCELIAGRNGGSISGTTTGSTAAETNQLVGRG
jgi:hypothetical protein